MTHPYEADVHERITRLFDVGWRGWRREGQGAAARKGLVRVGGQRSGESKAEPPVLAISYA